MEMKLLITNSPGFPIWLFPVIFICGLLICFGLAHIIRKEIDKRGIANG